MRVRLPFAPGLLLPPAIVLVLLAVVFAGTRVTNGVRAYVGGESLWSKAQKEGVAALYRYSSTGDEVDFEAYRLAQRIPDADRRAREELQGPSPDPEVARLAFIEGGNDPADAIEMVWIFRWFAWAPYFRDAIRIWGEADAARDELQVEAQALRALMRGGTSTLDERRAVLARIAEVDARLTRFESDFSSTIAAGARWVNSAKLTVVSVTGFLLVALGMLLMGRVAREQRRAIESERARAADRVRAEAVLRERDEQLRESQKLEAVGQLAGGVAHDFNNLLTVIQGNLELVRSAPVQDPELAEALDDALRAADRAAGLTAQLLTFSRRQVPQRRILQLNEIVSETRSMLQRVIGEQVRLTTDLDAHLPPVEGDPGQLSQVILNLVLNARDAMPAGGEILVRSHAKPGWSVLEVVDTGEGMDEATRARIFEPFFTTKKVGKGTGLGLATVYGIVSALGGSIDVRSAPGQGSTFSVRLPSREWPEPDDDPIHEDDSADADEAILVVEDEPSVRALATRILEGRGFRVHTAENGEEALAVLADPERPVQLVLSDVVMPEMGGRALSVAMRARGLRIPVLFMSGYTADADPLVCPSGRPAQLLGKPFTPAELAKRVRAVIDGA